MYIYIYFHLIESRGTEEVKKGKNKTIDAECIVNVKC